MRIKERKKGRPFKYYSRKELIKEIAQITDIVPEDIKYIVDVMEELLVKHLMEADEINDVEVEYIKGIRIHSRFGEAMMLHHPSNGKMLETFVPARIYFNARFTDFFKEKRIAEYREARKIFDDWTRISNEQWEQDKKITENWRERQKEELSKLDNRAALLKEMEGAENRNGKMDDNSATE